MKTFYLYFLLYFLTGNYFAPLIILFILYLIIDRFYIGLFSGFFEPYKRNRRIKRLLSELQLNTSNANAALEVGTLYFENKKYAKAVAYLQKASERINDSARLFAYLGMSHMELMQYDKGKEVIAKALEINRSVGYGLPFIYLIKYELSRDQVDKSELAKLEESLDKFANAENFYRMGKLYRKSGNKEKAQEMFDLAIKDYSYVQKNLRRLHRKWALLARFYRNFALSLVILILILTILTAGLTIAARTFNAQPHMDTFSTEQADRQSD